MLKFRMSKRYNGGQYFYLGSYGNIQMDKDTGAERHQMRFDLGNYISRDRIKEAQSEFFKEKFPSLTDRQIENKIRKAEELAGKK